MFYIDENYKHLRVCIPGRVIDLNDGTRQKDLQILYKRGYRGVGWIPPKARERPSTE